MAISPISLLFRAVDNASGKIKGIVGSLGDISFAYNNISDTIQSVVGQSQQLYAKLIGQNVELQQQLLSTQSSLAATNKIISQGVEVTDPTKAIQALSGPVNQAVADIRKGSLELVGVTSAQLIPLFQITAQNSANIGASLRESGDLTLSFAAALGTLQIPLDQARQELTSIYTAQITSDSQLAKSLGLNNQMVNQWKAQGILVEKLTDRLGAFRAGNALAAGTIEGVSSNIQEIFDEIARAAGEPLLKPIVTQLQVVYDFLEKNAGNIQTIAQNAVNFILRLGEKLGEVVKVLQPAIKTFSEAIFTQLGAEANAAANTLTILVDGLVLLVKTAAPVLEVVANITKMVAEFAATDIGGIIVQATLILGLLSSLAPVFTAITAAASIAATAMGLFTAAGGGVPGLIALLGVISPQLAAIAATATAAGGGIAGMGAAAAAAAPAIAAAIAPLLPLIALGGAIALALTIKKTGDLRVANEEIEEFRKQNNMLADESLSLAQKLKNLNDLERANGQLTEEQIKKRAAYQRISKDLVKSLEGQIEALKQVIPASKEQKRTIDVQIAQLQKQIDLQNKLGGGTQLQARDLQELGSVYEQLQKKVADAQSQFDNQGGGDAERFKKSAQEIVEFTNKQLELGQITREQAEEQLTRIRDDSRVEYEIRLSAADAITKARQSEVDKRVAIAELEQGKIDDLVKKGEISQVEGQRRTTESKKEQLKLQLQAVEIAIATEIRLREQQVNARLTSLDAELAAAEKARDEASAKGDKGGVRIANEDIEKIEAQQSAAKQSLKIESKRLGELKKQQQDFNSQIINLNAESRDLKNKERLKDFDEQLQLLEARNAKGLVGEQDFAAKSLDIQRQKAAAELKIIAESRAKLKPGDKEGLEALAAQEAAIQKKLAESTEQFEQRKSQAVVDGFDKRSAILESSLSSNLISQEEYNTRSLALTRQQVEAEIREINRQRQRTPASDTQKLLALAAREAAAKKKLAESTEQFEQRKSQAVVDGVRNRTAILESSFANNLISESEFNKRTLKLTQQRIDAELKELDRQRQRTPASDTKKLQEIEAKKAALRKESAEASEKFEQQKSQARIAILTAEQTVLEAKLSQGLITEADFAEQSLAITRKKLDEELAEVNRQRAKTAVGDTKRLAELSAKEADINKRRISALVAFQEQRVQIIEKAQAKALASLNQSEEERLQKLKILERDRKILDEDAAKQRLNISEDRIKEELRNEKEKLAQLEALPKISDPKKEEERQSKIRSSRLQTTRLTTRLIDNEISQQQALQKIIEKRLDKEIQQIRNLTTAQTQASQAQIELQKLATKNLESQVQLLQERKNLVSSVSGFYQSELNILKETAKTEQEKKIVGETAAEIKLKAVREEAIINREILELNIQQRDAALEQEKAQLSIQKIQARAATLTAQANLKKAQADPSKSAEAIEAEKLSLQAAVATEEGLQRQGQILQQRGGINARQAQQDRNAQARTQQSAEKEARLNLANARASKTKGDEEKRKLRIETLNDLGVSSIKGLSEFSKSLDSFTETFKVGKAERMIPQTKFQPRLNSTPITANLGGLETQLIKGIEKISASQAKGDITINLSNNFTKETPKQVATNTVDLIRKEMYNLAQEIQK